MNKTKKIPKGRPTAKPKKIVTDSDAAVSWLNDMTEDVFRDKLLREIFKGMKKCGHLIEFKNIHGANENGIDYILIERSMLGSQIWTGLQAKSKAIKASVDRGIGDSAIDVIRQCDRALIHDFTVDNRKSRLDMIHVWCSRPITSNAESDFSAPHTSRSIKIKRPEEIVGLVQEYCPEVLLNAPQCAIANYVTSCRNPEPEKFKLLNTKVNVRDHFIEPLFSTSLPESFADTSTDEKHGGEKNRALKLRDLMEWPEHILIRGAGVSGKTYLLKRAKYLASERNQITVLCDADYINETKFASAYDLLNQAVPLFKRANLETVARDDPFCLCIDDFDTVTPTKRALLLSTDPKVIRIIATARALTLTIGPHEGLKMVHIVGVDFLSVNGLLRSLEKIGQYDRPLIDRAQSFLQRTFATSGLPVTPFCVAMALEQLEALPNKLNTPTFGRLIQRFIDNQIGGQDDTAKRVDFETKRAFLRKYAGSAKLSISMHVFRRKVNLFLSRKGHKHTANALITDLFESGVVRAEHRGTRVVWAHGVVRQHFWLDSIQKKGGIDVIRKKLSVCDDVALASLIGSRLENAGDLISKLLDELPQIAESSHNEVLAVLQEEFGGIKLPEDDDEDRLLKRLENAALSGESWEEILEDKDKESKNIRAPQKRTKRERDELQRRIEPILLDVAASKLHLVFNLAGILINARDTDAEIKLRATRQLLDAFERYGKVIFRMSCEIAGSDQKMISIFYMVSRWMVVNFSDQMLGDPFLSEIFLRLLNEAKPGHRKLLLLDLLLCCGEDVGEQVIETLRAVRRYDAVLVFYLRVMHIYQHRFHRIRDKDILRKLLRDIRRTFKYDLPALPQNR